jgi:hypothetical protein
VTAVRGNDSVVRITSVPGKSNGRGRGALNKESAPTKVANTAAIYGVYSHPISGFQRGDLRIDFENFARKFMTKH